MVDEAGAHCEITACAEGERMTGDGTCTAEQPVLCLPCEVDLDCELHAPGARCLPAALSGNRCGRMCDSGEDCPPGFRCVADSRTSVPQCEPSTGTCSCTEELIGVEVACLLRADDGHACAGVQRCDAGGLGECMPALSEACNGVDDDCDGVTDEGFVDDAGRYVTEEHCGGCAQACVPSGPNLAASCELDADGDPGCLIECAAGFVDVDGLLATGCECELTDGPGVVIGGDADCDGEVDETPEFIFVAQTGDDDDTGEDPERPVRTIQRGLERGAATGRDVLVARGIYRGPVELAAGVTLVGGYSPDFRVRDELLHPVVIEDPDGSAGMPMLVCTEIDEPTLIDGFTVVASDAEDTGRGSTAVYLDRCSDAVALQNLTVIAGRGAAGVPGEDSSETIDKWSLSSLGQLAGVDGGSGRAGNELLTACPEVVAGAGGRKTCPRGAVTGGDGGNAICPDLTAVCVNGSAMPCGNSGCTDFTSGGVCDIEAAEAAAEPGTRPAADGMGEGAGQAGALTYPSPTNRVECIFCDDNPTLSR
ncbi:MAG: hypothetical protein OXT09_28595, partial [Myxococcales bacterium]|nr:hypothetical protein [Myxococcales bacterium]